MPIYEYRCKDCEHDFTIIESLKDHEGAEPNCPECKSSSVERVIGSVCWRPPNISHMWPSKNAHLAL